MDVGEIMTVMTSPVALLAATAFSGAMLGGAIDRVYLAARDRLDSPAAVYRRHLAIARIVRRGGVPDRSGWQAGDTHEDTRNIDTWAAAAPALAPPLGLPPSGGSRVRATPADPVADAGAGPAAAGPAPPGVPVEVPTGVPDANPVSGRCQSAAAGGMPPPPAVEKSGRRPGQSESPASTLIFVRPGEQVDEFLAHVRDCMLGKCPESGRYELSLTDVQWVAAYRTWARANAIAVLPQEIFLKYLGHHVRDKAGVEKRRQRIKDPATGAVLRNARGTPLRETRYAVVEYTPPAKAAPVKSREDRIAALEHGQDDETWAETMRRCAA